MAGEPRRAPMPMPTSRVSPFQRICGLGSVFGKTLRDARGAMLLVTGLLGVILIGGGAAMSSTYGTLEARQELATLSGTMPPILRGLYGNPVNVDTLGGFLSWHYGAYLALIAGLWSVLALSSTLAGEARRGSLDFTAATPRSIRSIAFGKIGGHVAAMAAVCALLAAAAWLTGQAFARLPGDGIAVGAALGWAAGIGVKAIAAGSIAFALSTFLGRGAAAGIAGAVMVAGYVLQGYRAVVPAFDALAPATWFSWTANHLPLAGRSDWAAVALTALFGLLLLALGVEAFARRDIGVTLRLPWPRLPGWLVGIGGPTRRSFGDLLPGAAWWGVGLAIYGLVMAAASRSLTDAINAAPDLAAAVRTLVPGIDLTTAAGFLQIAFADLGFVLVGIAVATFVATRSADESAGRLEMQLASPLTPRRWAASSGVAIGLAVGLVAILLAAAIALGVASTGQDPWQPASGVIVLALYGLGLMGVGVAVAGMFGAGVAAPTVLAIAIGTFLLDFMAPAMNLPGWMEQLALTHHLGSPMVGTWDLVGVTACLVLAVGGMAAGALTMARRDVGG